jgi:hypothetical protein
MIKSFVNRYSPWAGSSAKFYLILFLFWPLLAFITALASYSKKESRTVVYLFLIYFGLTFVVGSAGNDAERYALMLRNNAQMPFSAFFSIVGGLYSDTTVDVVEPLISFIVSRFTSYAGILFAVYAAIFSFFYLKSVDLLFPKYQDNKGWNSSVFFIFFILVLPITAINGFRMWTAAWIFFYGAYHVVLNRDIKFLAVALSASLVHFSFISANIILIIYFFAGNRNMIYIPITLLSFVLPRILAPVFQMISIRFGGGLQARYETYSNEGYVISQQEMYKQAAWFLNLSNELIFYYLIFAIIIVKIRYGNLMRGKVESNLFSFLLLLLAFVNFGKAIPSLGERFLIVFLLFATLYMFLFSIKLSIKGLNLITIIGLFPMLLHIAVAFRQGAECINAWLFTPLLGLPLFVPNISLFDFLFS